MSPKPRIFFKTRKQDCILYAIVVDGEKNHHLKTLKEFPAHKLNTRRKSPRQARNRVSDFVKMALQTTKGKYTENY